MRTRNESFRTKGFSFHTAEVASHSMSLKVKLSFKLFVIMLHKSIAEAWHPDYNPDYDPDYDRCQGPPGCCLQIFVIQVESFNTHSVSF